MSDAFEKWAEDKTFLIKVSEGEGYVNIREMAREVWQAALQSGEPVVPEGYVLVPVEPTEKMIKAGFGYDPDENCTYRLHPAQAYRAMLSAGKGGE